MIQRVIASCEITTPVGLRDRAILLLLARLALLAGDIVTPGWTERERLSATANSPGAMRSVKDVHLDRRTPQHPRRTAPSGAQNEDGRTGDGAARVHHGVAFSASR